MQSKQLYSGGGLRTFAIVLDEGDEVIESVTGIAEQQGFSASHVTGLGAFSDVVLGYFVKERREYKHIEIAEQVEVVSLVGDAARGENGELQLHFHVVVAKSDARAYGGHLIAAHVSPTLEVILSETPAHLTRRHDPATGLALISI